MWSQMLESILQDRKCEDPYILTLHICATLCCYIFMHYDTYFKNVYMHNFFSQSYCPTLCIGWNEGSVLYFFLSLSLHVWVLA